jgi:nitrite reductase/ring-hydroxylating ferredoxin subunit
MFGLAAVTAGGYLGGYLVFTRRAGVDVEVPVADLRAWRAVCTFDELHEAMPFGVDVDGARVVVVRRGEAVYALAATCSHAGGPLDEGCVAGGMIRCPWHGSEFALYDGAVRRGPATSTQPVYDARAHEGKVEIRGPVPAGTIVLSDEERARRVRLAGAAGPFT